MIIFGITRLNMLGNARIRKTLKGYFTPGVIRIKGSRFLLHFGNCINYIIIASSMHHGKEHKRIITIGHYAWYSENSLDELQKKAAQNMIALLQNQSTEDSLNK